MADVTTLKKVACDAIDAAAAELHKVSQDIWENPELNFEEKHAHAVRIWSFAAFTFKKTH